MKKTLQKAKLFAETYADEIALFSTAAAVAIYSSYATYVIVSDRTRITGAAALLNEDGTLTLFLQNNAGITKRLLRPADL